MFLHNTCRAEVVAYYSALSDEAEKRKARAEWRLQRLGHTPQRQALLLEEEEAWRREMEAMGSKPQTEQQLPTPEQKIRRKTWKESLAERDSELIAAMPPVLPDHNPRRKTWKESLAEQQRSLGSPLLPGALETESEVSPEDNPVVSRAYEDGEKELIIGQSLGMESNLGMGIEPDVMGVKESPHSIPVESDGNADSVTPSLTEAAMADTTPAAPASTHTPHSHPHPSTAQELIYQQLPAGTSPPLHSRGPCEHPSQIQHLLYPAAAAALPPSLHPDGSGLSHQDHGVPLLRTSRGHAPLSTVQRLMYPLDRGEKGLVTQEECLVTLEESLATADGKDKVFQPFQDDFSILGMYSKYVHLRLTLYGSIIHLLRLFSCSQTSPPDRAWWSECWVR